MNKILITLDTEINSRWFNRMYIYDYSDIEMKEINECEYFCELETSLVKHYNVEIDGTIYQIPETICVEVPDDFVADERVKDIHNHVYVDLMQSGDEVKDYQKLGLDIHDVDIFNKNTEGKLYEEFKKEMRGIGQ